MPQGTVKQFDVDTRSGTLLLDNQEELAFDAQIFHDSGLMELRLGQRVRVEYTDSGDTKRITSIQLVSF